MGKWKPIVIISVIWILVLVGIQENVKDNIRADNNQRLLDSLMIGGPGNEPSRGFDYKTNQYIKYQKTNYTDEDIRQLRKDNPDKIIRLKNRNVVSEKQEFEDRVEQYIEDHHDEIIERYRD